VRTRNLNSLYQKAVQEVCSCVQSFSPLTPGKESLDKQSADDIVNGTNDTFNFYHYVGMCMGTSSGAVCHSIGGRSGWKSCQTCAIVTLDGIDLLAELIRHIRKEIGQSG
jgi:hypothetical protein